MRDKMIRNRRKSGDSVGASVDTHLDDVVSPLEVTFTEQLVDGEILPDLRIVLRILQRLLAAAVQDLVTAGDRHLREVDNDIKLRQRRDELVTVLEHQIFPQVWIATAVAEAVPTVVEVTLANPDLKLEHLLLAKAIDVAYVAQIEMAGALQTPAVDV